MALPKDDSFAPPEEEAGSEDGLSPRVSSPPVSSPRVSSPPVSSPPVSSPPVSSPRVSSPPVSSPPVSSPRVSSPRVSSPPVSSPPVSSPRVSSPRVSSPGVSSPPVSSPRVLSQEQQDRLRGERALVSDFKLMKLEKEAQKNWDLFYKRNTTNFFKDRHWTTREFEELKARREFESQRLVLLEAGCGVGNCLFPLLEDDLHLFVYACDFSPRAVEFVKQNPLYCPERCSAFQCDLTQDDLRDNVPEGSVDVVTLIFVLSAVHPDKMKLALQNISRVLKPGGIVLFRDYGLYDHAMLRFKAGSKLGENFYVRQDGTRSYFFSKELLAELFADAGLRSVSNDYVLRETVNKKEGLCVPRVFLQSKFTKPGQSESS